MNTASLCTRRSCQPGHLQDITSTSIRAGHDDWGCWLLSVEIVGTELSLNTSLVGIPIYIVLVFLYVSVLPKAAEC